MSKFIKLFMHPLLLAKVVTTLIFVRRQLSKGKFSFLIKSASDSNKRIWLPDLNQVQYADWALRNLCSRWSHSSPCLCHSLVLYRLARPGVILRISAQKTDEFATHASVVFEGKEFSMADSWRDKPVFAEFTKGEQT